MAQPSGRPEIGAILGDQYRITRVLGEGVTSVVFEAVNVRLGQRLAIRVPQPALLAQPAVIERFTRSARAAVRLRSRNTVRVIDVAVSAQGIPFIVTELLEGHDLAAEMAERGPLPMTVAVDYVRQACSAMGEAHSHGIVHRALEPSSLFLALEPDGTCCVKVLNLGLALTHAEVVQLGIAAERLGPPLYLSPEQVLSSKVVDQRSDVWSLGAILYALLAGVPPFAGDSASEIEAAIALGEPAPIARDDLPSDLEPIVHKALAKKPEDRFASTREMMLALTPFAGGSAVSTSPPPARDGVELAGRALHAGRSPTSTAPPAPEEVRHPRWRTAALLTPMLIVAPVLYMARCNRTEHARDEQGVNTTALVVTPTAERSAPEVPGWAPEAVAGEMPDAATSKSAEPPGPPEPTPSVTAETTAPTVGHEPMQRPAADGRHKVPAPPLVKTGSLASTRSVASKAMPTTKPVNATSQRSWDEDSPEPP